MDQHSFTGKKRIQEHWEIRRVTGSPFVFSTFMLTQVPDVLSSTETQHTFMSE